MPSTILTRNGLLATLDLTGVPDHTDLKGHDGWEVYQNPVDGDGSGLYEIVSGEIASAASVGYAMALWINPSVAAAGHCVRADVMSPVWASKVPGLIANGSSDHTVGDTRCDLGNTWEMMQRSGNDYGAGFPISSGTTPGQPLTNGNYYNLLFASVQQPSGGSHPRGGMAYNNTQIAMGDTTLGLLTGNNDMMSIYYPGLLYWNTAGMRWRNYKVYADYRISVTGLSGSQAFRIYDAGGGILISSSAQVATEAHVLVHTMTWPFTGHLQIFQDNTFTPGQETPGGRFPAAGTTANFQGGNVYALSTLGAGIQINYDLEPNFPAEWFTPTDKDVTADCIEYDVLQIAGNPRIEVDTATVILKDPDGRWVPARTNSALYPNVRLGRPMRMVFEEPEGTACRFYGKIASYRPVPFNKTADGNDAEQQVEIRAESPMRELSNSENTLTFAFVGPLVNPDGSGVISSILDLVADIIPLEVRELGETKDVIPEGFLSVGMTVQTALEQCAIYSDSIYFINPHWKVAPDEPNFFFVWMSREAQEGAVADHTWVDTDDDIHDMDPVYAADVL